MKALTATQKFLMWWFIGLAILAAAATLFTPGLHAQNGAPITTSRINQDYYAGINPYQSSIQLAVSGLCNAFGLNHTGSVYIKPGVQVSDTIAAATGCAGAVIVDQRTFPWACYTWTGSGPFAAASCTGGGVAACPEGVCIVPNPTADQSVSQPGKTSLNGNRINNVMYLVHVPGANVATELTALYAQCPTDASTSCLVKTPPGNKYTITSSFNLPAINQYTSLDCQGSILEDATPGVMITVMNRNDDKPTGDISHCQFVNAAGNTTSTAFIHQLPRATFAYNHNSFDNATNPGNIGVWVDNTADTPTYSERASFDGNFFGRVTKGVLLQGSHGGTNSFARMIFTSTNTCSTGPGQVCLSVEGDGSPQSAFLYNGQVSLYGNIEGRGIQLLNGGTITTGTVYVGVEGSGTAIYIDANGSGMTCTGIVDTNSEPITVLGTSDTFRCPNLTQGVSLQAPPFLFGLQQARNSKFNFGIDDVGLGQPYAESGLWGGVGTLQLYHRVTGNADPEVDATPPSGNMRINDLYWANGKFGFGPGFGKSTVRGGVEPKHTIDLNGDMQWTQPVVFPSGTDANTLTNCGYFQITAGVNAPPGITTNVTYQVLCTGNPGYVAQIAYTIESTTNHTWQRTKLAGSWGSWIRTDKDYIALASGTDLNSVTACGIYDVSDPVNGPPSGGLYHLEVMCGSGGAGYVYQRITDGFTNSNITWQRTDASGVWNTWAQYAFVAPKTWECQTGAGDGTNVMTSNNVQDFCLNQTGSIVTLTGFKCYADAGAATLVATNHAGTALITAVTCTTSYAAATQTGTVSLASGDSIKFTFTPAATTKSTTWTVKGTY